MTSTLERLDGRVADARKQLDKAVAKRDDAITSLIRSVAKIKEAQRALARLEKRRNEARTAEKADRRAAAGRKAQEPMPVTM